ncbi:hypothetical protein FOA52_002816 [Chlamydomonas sp. UWO 241]|nr:hypothetical protein FOA52_002816 [Chlamydomonas sp. UWO 241]
MAPSDEPQVVIVTGCTADGIGHALVLRFAEQGCTVYATARRPESVGPVPDGVTVLALDVTSAASVSAAVEAVIQKSGRINVLVNNAGMPCVGPLAEVNLGTARAAFETNVVGLLAVVQAVVPHMAAARRGRIVNVGSVVGYVPAPFAGVYAASKAAVHSMTDCMRLELAPLGIQVMLVAPGAIRSNFGTNATVDTSHLKLYAPYADTVVARAGLSQGARATPAAVFACEVVGKVIGCRRMARTVMFGHMVWMFQLLMTVPAWLRDWGLARKFGLHVPYDKVKANAKKAA